VCNDINAPYVDDIDIHDVKFYCSKHWVEGGMNLFMSKQKEYDEMGYRHEDHLDEIKDVERVNKVKKGGEDDA
jgi:hypothetical protein